MRKHFAQRHVVAALAGAAASFSAGGALASNPLEYPDNGAAQFSRGGAWLALANEPIAVHYNPAALAIQGSGFSVDQNLAWDKVCYERKGADGQFEVADPLGGEGKGLQYLPACTNRKGFPSALPSMAITFRVAKKVGIGMAVVPPAAYVTVDSAFSATKLGYNQAAADCIANNPNCPAGTNPYQQAPSPWRYMQLDQLTTVLFPTISIGAEILPNFRVGAGFIAGIAVINSSQAGIDTESKDRTTDHAQGDGISRLQAKDLFVPGAIVSLHWSPHEMLDVAAWGRWIDDIYTTHGDLTILKDAYNKPRLNGPPPYSQIAPQCRQADLTTCTPNATSQLYEYPDSSGTFKHLRFPIPPEVRVGARFHLPREGATPSRVKGISAGTGGLARDPLHEDLFDIELDGTYAKNSAANTIEARFADNGAGQGGAQIPPGFVPPNADRWNGFKDSFGIRLGGQWNAIPDKLGVRAGTWMETQSQDPKWLHVGWNGGQRGGFGGGIVLRQDFIDFSFGYQRHWSQGLDNHGQGAMRTLITSGNTGAAADPNINNEPPGVTAADRREYRSAHTVNDGRITQSAHVFTLGATVRF